MENLGKIILVEDSPADAVLIEKVLKSAGYLYSIRTIDNKEEYIYALKEFQPDIVLCDHYLPDFNSFEALRIFKESGLEVPFIIVTGAIKEEYAALFAAEGADDYVMKNNLSRLPVVLRNVMKFKKIERERNEALKKVENSKNLLKILLESTNQFMLFINRDGRINLVNSYFESIIGLSTLELKGKLVWELLFHKEEIARFRKRIADISFKKQTETFDTEMITGDGRPIRLSCTAGFLLNDGDENDSAIVLNGHLFKENDPALKPTDFFPSQLNRLLSEDNKVIWSVEIGDVPDVFMSRSAEKIFGVPPKAFAMLSGLWKELIYPLDLPIIEQALLKILSGKSYHAEFRIVKPTSEIIWLESTVRPVLNEDGKLTHVEGISTDITEFKNREEDLINKEARHRTLLENIQEGLLYVDNSDKIQFANKHFCLLTGYSLKELSGKPFSYLYADDHLQEGHSLNDKWTALRPRELKLRKKSGEILWVNSKGTLVKDKKGNIIGSFTTNSDITDRKLSESYLKSSVEKYRQFFNENPMPMFILDANDLSIMDVNDAAVSQYMYSRDEFKRMNLFSLHPSDDLAKVQEIVDSISSFKSVEPWRHLRKDGSTVYVEFYIHSIKPDDDEHCILIVNNITERFKEIEELNFTISSMNTFIYKATHDLKGPLSSIKGLANVAKMEVQEPVANKYLDMIYESTGRLDNILHALIETMSVKKSEITYEKIHFDQLIHDILKRLEYADGSKEVEFRISIKNKHSFSSDFKILNSILQNLIENAVKYRDITEKKPFCNIEIQDVKDGVSIHISDNGIGMSTEVQSKVFDMFFRAHRDSKGTGLGLYIVKDSIERLGGSIKLESEEGKGSSFNLFLPDKTEAIKEIPEQI
jgi:PAS domain S-box-containing protein